MHPYWLIAVSSALALLPIVVGLATSYLKVQIVFSLLRSGLGTQQVPSGLVIMALSLAVTLFVMSPVIDETADAGAKINLAVTSRAPTWALVREVEPVLTPWQRFMLRHSGTRELAVLSAIRQAPGRESFSMSAEPAGVATVSLPSWPVLVLSFMLTELRESFVMGFLILLPFLVIDLIVANVLTGLGMMMVSPAMIALPLKIVVFILADGWLLLTRSLVQSYGG